MSHRTDQPSPIDQVDAALDDILRRRAQLLAHPLTPQRAVELAELADLEAACWEAVVEQCRTRVYWRAALSAREHARSAARRWCHHAQQPPASTADTSAVGAVA